MVESVNPLAMEVALSVQKELHTRFEEADHLRRAHVERARFEAEPAERRYMRVDPLCHLDRNVASELSPQVNTVK
jgi:hypothetical protein